MVNKLTSLDLLDQFREILESLEYQYSLFYTLADIGIPKLTNEISTAAVSFDSEGEQIEFLFNPEFWKNSSDYTKLFTICHECLHVILNHGLRALNVQNPKIANVALDIVVNHMLVNKFNFNRDFLPIADKLCWIDTVFDSTVAPTVEENRSFEYYYNLLTKNKHEDKKSLDDHSFLSSISDALAKKISDALSRNKSQEEMDNFVRKCGEDLEPDSKVKAYNEYKKMGYSDQIAAQYAGTTSAHLAKLVKTEYVIKKKKWESVITKWTRMKMSDTVNVESWVHENRRTATMSKNLIIPSLVDAEKYEKEKINVWFYQDTSGSCVHLAPRFLKAARSIPKDRFNIRAFCFDTSIYEIDLKKDTLYGFGGTYFHIIENHIQQEIKAEKIKNYPDAVFIITDGYGDRVYPEIPKRWFWFLSVDYKRCIPKESNIFMLDQFE